MAGAEPGQQLVGFSSILPINRLLVAHVVRGDISTALARRAGSMASQLESLSFIAALGRHQNGKPEFLDKIEWQQDGALSMEAIEREEGIDAREFRDLVVLQRYPRHESQVEATRALRVAGYDASVTMAEQRLGSEADGFTTVYRETGTRVGSLESEMSASIAFLDDDSGVGMILLTGTDHYEQLMGPEIIKARGPSLTVLKGGLAD